MNTPQLFLFVLTQLSCLSAAAQSPLTLNHKDDGYRGIWYSNQPSQDEYVYKYSGGLGTYPANHYPFSIYAKEVHKTFFCYGGTTKDGKTLLHIVSYFDHKTGMVPRPTIVLDKKTDNAHDNPVINMDKDGYIWLFSTAHGTNSPSYVHKSTKPYDISEFKQVPVSKSVDGKKVPLDNFSYLQTWYQKDNGFLNLFTHYDRNVIAGQPSKPRRTISYMTSPDGIDYSEWKDLATIEEGHYQTSGCFQNKIIGSAFNFHPVKQGENGLNYRTNLYYIQTKDFGETWQSAEELPVKIPVADINNPTLVKDYHSLGSNVYINDLSFDKNGRPVILFLTSKGYESGPKSGPREWKTARYTGNSWEIRPITTSGSNYDMGSLYIDSKGRWHVIGPTTMGPQGYNTGGEMVRWTSKNQGKSWKSKQLTFNSLYNHSYARRPVYVHKDFYAFWADGHGRKKSDSRLYFCDKKGNVFMLPQYMQKDFEQPLKIRKKRYRAPSSLQN